MDPLAAIRETFFQECEEQLAELESGLLAMESGDTDPETINAVFRAVHSIKGGAGAFSLDALVRFAHVFETALDEMRSGRLAPTDNVVKTLLRAADVLADLVRAAHDNGTVDEAHSAALVEELKALGPEGAGDETEGEEDWGDFSFQPLSAAAPAAPAAGGGWRVRFKPRADLYAKANEAALLLRELTRLGEAEVELDARDVPPLSDLDPEAAYLSWTIRLTGDTDETTIREVFEFVDGDCDLDVQPIGGPDGHGDDEGGDGGGEPAFDISALLAKVADDAAGDPPPAAEPDPQPAATVAVGQPANDAQPEAQAGSRHKTEAGATIRVDLERVDRMIDLVGW